MSSRSLSILLVLALANPGAGSAAQLIPVAEALAAAFPGAQIRPRPLFLTAEQRAEVRRQAGSSLPSAMVMRYEAYKEGSLVGVAYTDTHRVRTLAATLLVVLTPWGVVNRVEVLSFAEPLEYLPRREWFASLQGRSLDEELALKRGVRPVAGATLSAAATVEAVRRVLALHSVVSVEQK